MGAPADLPKARLNLVERTIDRVRVGVVSGMAFLVAINTGDAANYRSAAAALVTVAAIYTIAMMASPSRFSGRVSTGLDLSLTIGIIATTGAGRSLLIGVLFLIVVTAALRFKPQTSRVVALISSVALGAVVVSMPRPDLSMGARLQIAGGWAALIIFGAVLVGLLAQFELDDRLDLRAARDAAARLEETDRHRRFILRTIAHDLTPSLEAIRGISRTLTDPQLTLDHATERESLQLIHEHAKYLKGFASSLRQVANANDPNKLSSSSMVDVHIAALIESVCRLGSFGRPSPIQLDFDPDLPDLVTDADKLRRILINVIENAHRHSPAGTPISVAASHDAGWFEITVTDAGPGLSEQDLTAAFQANWQSGDSPGESGLGLWIVAELASQLGGTATMANVVPHGINVTIRLPSEIAQHTGIAPGRGPG